MPCRDLMGNGVGSHWISPVHLKICRCRRPLSLEARLIIAVACCEHVRRPCQDIRKALHRVVSPTMQGAELMSCIGRLPRSWIDIAAMSTASWSTSRLSVSYRYCTVLYAFLMASAAITCCILQLDVRGMRGKPKFGFIFDIYVRGKY